MRTRPGPKVLGLCALVTGAMAIGNAGAAQAEAGACWGYLPSLTVLKCFGENVGGTPLEPTPRIEFWNGISTLLIAFVNIEILCTGAKVVEGGQLGLNGTILLGRLEFSGCISRKSDAQLEKLAACTPKDPVGGSGRIRTEKGTGLIVLHELVSGVREPVLELNDDPEFPAPEKDILAKIFLGEECAVSEEIIVTGKLILQDTTGKGGFEGHSISHTIQEFAPLQLMKVGINKATIDGSAIVSLMEHIAIPWAGRPA